jgi:hypothetical protein
MKEKNRMNAIDRHKKILEISKCILESSNSTIHIMNEKDEYINFGEVYEIFRQIRNSFFNKNKDVFIALFNEHLKKEIKESKNNIMKFMNELNQEVTELFNEKNE